MCKKIIEIFGKENYKELDKVFEISEIDEESNFLLRELRRKIIEKYNKLISSLDDLINPDSTYIQMFDSHVLTDLDRNTVISTIVKLGEVVKLHTLLEFETHEDSEKDFCLLALKTYNENVGNISDLFTKIKHAYRNIKKTKIDINYLG